MMESPVLMSCAVAAFEGQTVKRTAGRQKLLLLLGTLSLSDSYLTNRA